MLYDMRVVRFLKTTPEQDIHQNTTADFICLGQFDMMHISQLDIDKDKPLLAIQSDRDKMVEQGFGNMVNRVYSLYLLKQVTPKESEALDRFWNRATTFTVVTRIHCEHNSPRKSTISKLNQGTFKLKFTGTLPRKRKLVIPCKKHSPISFSALLENYCLQQLGDNSRTICDKKANKELGCERLFQAVCGSTGRRSEVWCMFYDSLELGDTVAILKGNSLAAILEVIQSLSNQMYVKDTYTYSGIDRRLMQDSSYDLGQYVPENGELGHVSVWFSVRNRKNADYFMARMTKELENLAFGQKAQFYVTGTADRTIYFDVCQERQLLELMRNMTMHGDEIHHCFNDVITRIGIVYDSEEKGDGIVPVNKTPLEKEILCFAETVQWLRGDIKEHKKIDWRFTLLKLMGALKDLYQNYVTDDLADLLIPGVQAFLVRLNSIRSTHNDTIPDWYREDILDILQCWTSLSSDIFQMESQLTYHPELHAVRYYIPAMVLRFELCLMHFCSNALSSKDNKQRYIPLLIPEDVRDLSTQCPLDPKMEQYQAETPLLVMIPYKDLYHPWETALRLIHEMAHYCEDEGRCRVVRHSQLVECVARYIVNFWYKSFFKGRNKAQAYSKSMRYINKLSKEIQKNILPEDGKEIWYMEETFNMLQIQAGDIWGSDWFLECYLTDVDPNYFLEDAGYYKQVRTKASYLHQSVHAYEELDNHLKLLVNLCRECYADIAMILVTGCSFEEYYQCMYRDHFDAINRRCSVEDGSLEEPGIMEIVVRMALVIKAMSKSSCLKKEWETSKLRSGDAYHDSLVQSAVSIADESDNTSREGLLLCEDDASANYASHEDFNNLLYYLCNCVDKLEKDMLRKGSDRYNAVTIVREGINLVKNNAFDWAGIQSFLLQETMSMDANTKC